MKIKLRKGPSEKKEPAKKDDPEKLPGPKEKYASTLDEGSRFNFLLPDELRRDMEDIIEQGKKHGIRLSFSYLLREGASNEIERFRDKFRKAEKGELHAKKRK